MKFWLTVIFSIVFTSAALTWLTMKVGGSSNLEDPYQSQAAPPDAKTASSTTDEKPKLEMVLGEKQKQVANVVEMVYGDCYIDKEYSAEFRYRNAGKAPLNLVLTGLSCECLKEFTIDGNRVRIQEQIEAKPAGHEGVLKLAWLPTDKQLPPRAPPKEQRFTAKLFTTDPGMAEMHLEIVVRLINNKE